MNTERTFDIERTMHDDSLDMWRERHESDPRWSDGCNAPVTFPSVDVYVSAMSADGE